MKTFCAAALLLAALAAPAFAAGEKPADRLDTARLLIFDRNWPGAIAELRRVLQDAKEPLRDEARFWLAHSLFQMGNATEALQIIDVIEREHARSRWMLPAQSLRVEIATRIRRPDVLWRIAETPQPPSAPRPPLMRTPLATPRPPQGAPAPPPPDSFEVFDMPTPPALTFTDVRIQALSGLLRQDPARAVPALREIVVDDMETPQARRALLVLGLSAHEEARETVIEFAKTGPEGLRVVAVEQLGRWPTVTTRNVLTAVYGSGSQRVKLEVLRSLREAGADRELIRLARSESDATLRGYAIAQLRELDTNAARAFLRTVK